MDTSNPALWSALLQVINSLARTTIEGITYALFFIVDSSIRNKKSQYKIKLIVLLNIELYSETKGISSIIYMRYKTMCYVA